MDNKIIFDLMKEFSNSNIAKLKIKYKKLEIELEKGGSTEDTNVLTVKNINGDKINKDEKWILSPIVRKIL